MRPDVDYQALEERYRIWFNSRHGELPVHRSAKDVPVEARVARLQRDKASHRGIARRTGLVELETWAVNQPFLDEIGALTKLEYLELGWPVTATDLSPLRALTRLTTLKIDSPRNIRDFTPILALPALERLIITNAKHMAELDWLAPLKDRLKVLGIEGAMWTTQRIDSLTPLEGFRVEALLLANCRVADGDLAWVVATMPDIAYLSTSRFWPRDEFRALEAAKPDLDCDWFDDDMWNLRL